LAAAGAQKAARIAKTFQRVNNPFGRARALV
jgi:hypothetical protein